MAKPVLILQHDSESPPGTIATWLSDAGVAYDVIEADRGEPVPADPTAYAALILLGGGQSANSDENFSWRQATFDLIRQAAAMQVPTLGICLGAQLIAHAMGGRVERGESGIEVGPMLLGRKDVSYNDELFALLPMALDGVQFHREAIPVLPPGAVHLVGGPVYDHQAFRVGANMWATQFHIETTAEIFAGWVEKSRDYFERKGIDADLLLTRYDGVHQYLTDTWAPFIVRFAALPTPGTASA